MKFLIITVDTEADWFDKSKNKISSVKDLDFLQEACVEYAMIPTYLITYEMATKDEAIRVIKKYLDQLQCEIGHHLHVWSTPPFENANSWGVDEKWIRGIQSELPDDIFERKMESLHDAIEKNYGISPVSHRAGRWAIDSRTLLWLAKNKYHVDSSVCPYLSWTHVKGVDDYIKTDTRYAPNTPYYPSFDDITKEATKKENRIGILEAPATGIKGDFLSGLALRGIGRLRSIFNKIGYCGVGNMSFRPSSRLPLKVFQKLTHGIFQADLKFINFMLHSTELTLGASPHSVNRECLSSIRRKISFVLRTAKEYGIKGITLSDIPRHMNEKWD